MKTFMLCFASAAAFLRLTSACSSTSDCEALSNCAPNAGSSGAAGAAGAAGDTSSSGASGSSPAGGSGESGGSEDGGSAGVSGAAGEGGMPCAGTGRPSEAPCLVSDEYAVFVAPSGNAGAPGTKLAPVKTLAEAVALAGTDKIVIACDGSYDEQLKLTTGARLYGGFSCPGSVTPWSYEAGKRATVAPVARGLALSVAAGASAVVIEDFEFDAQPGVDAGNSSVAGFVNASSDVTLQRVKLVAGKGVDGANGALTPVVFPAQSVLAGHSAMGDAGGLFNLAVCPVGGNSKGGAGGNGGLAVAPGSNGTPDLGMGKGGAQETACNSGGGGGDGANAAPQSPAPGATQLGTITTAGWLGASGTDGASGTPGQGGGGGTGADAGGGGGGGGAGGCGGAAGTGGKAGGSSIALLVLDASVTLAEAQLIAADAGRGGAGVLGQDGQAQVGNGGLPDANGGCQGGKGGKGGKGGAGGGAAGGVSVGIVYQGTKPAIDELSTTLIGAAGAKGVGGVVGTNDGIDGKAQDLLELP